LGANVAYPQQAQIDAWDEFERVYRGALNHVAGGGQLNSDALHRVRVAYVNYLKAIELDERVIKIIDAGFGAGIDARASGLDR